eukprot:scaffold11298_cov50-Attheya_sp.AAC.1
MVMIHQRMQSMLSVVFCLQVTTGVYGLDLERFHELMEALPACQASMEALRTEEMFHGDRTCDRKMRNDPVTRAPHDLRLKEFTPSQSMKIPREQTLYCPPITTHEALLSDQEAPVVVGHNERWILNNEATKPVSVSFWSQKERKLVSAFNPNISPAHHDQEAIINPGGWRVGNGWQGHVFVMHQLEWVEGELVQGRILATHRIGLVPIGLNFEAPPNMAAMPTKTNSSSSSEPPNLPPTYNKDSTNEQTPSNPTSTHKDFTTERALSNSASTPNPWNRMEFCNVANKGFINEANYPVDLYFAGHLSTVSNSNNHDKFNETSDCDENDSNNLPSCQQPFELHLGVHHDHNNNDAGWNDPSQDAHHTLDDWESPLKYDGTYISHTFVARLHHDPSIIVQEYTVSPVIVRDCSIKEDNKESIIHQAGTVAMTSTSTIPSFHLAAPLSNSTLLYNMIEQSI